ncbi:MAG: DUF2799 domain-containing protein [Hyphomonadaceae bacterium]|nr:DUF2799 domain-containing protein [Hyphomonadaceae bacterium]
MRFVLLACSCLSLAGCASMSKSECVYADWRAIGYEDGANGHTASVISSRRQACAKAGVTPDMDAYLAGRDAGLAEYCTPANGFSTGESGYSYNGVCGRHDEASFLEQHRLGARLYMLRERASSASYALRQANDDLGATRYAITQTATAIIRPDLTVAERAAQVVELTRLTEEGERIERSIPALRTNVDIAEAELHDYETHLASRALPVRSQVAVR